MLTEHTIGMPVARRSDGPIRSAVFIVCGESDRGHFIDKRYTVPLVATPRGLIIECSSMELYPANQEELDRLVHLEEDATADRIELYGGKAKRLQSYDPSTAYNA